MDHELSSLIFHDSTLLYLPKVSFSTILDLLLLKALSFPCKLMVGDGLNKRPGRVAISDLDGERRNTKGTESGFNSCIVRPNGGDFSILAACFSQSCSLA